MWLTITLSENILLPVRYPFVMNRFLKIDSRPFMFFHDFMVLMLLSDFTGMLWFSVFFGLMGFLSDFLPLCLVAFVSPFFVVNHSLLCGWSLYFKMMAF